MNGNSTMSQDAGKVSKWYHEIAKTSDGSLPEVTKYLEQGRNAEENLRNDQWLAQNSRTTPDGGILYSTPNHCTSAALA